MFDERKARRVTGFIECLKHTKGEFHGKPFKLLPWQEKIIRDVFGTVRDDDPTMRQYTTAYIEIPKKQGKSELGAAIALNMLANDDEWKAEVYSCASDRQQAAIVFDVAVDMVKQSPALSKRIKIIPSMKRMVYQPTGSIYQVLSSEVATKHGLNVSAWLPEETLSLRVRRDHVPYDQWAKRGFIHTTEGNVVHYGFIEQFICQLGERYNIREIAHDRWNATMMVQTLEDDGFTMVPFGQGFKDMSPPTKELMRLVLEHKLCHGGHPVLRWNMDNAYVRTDPAGNLKLDKEKSTEKVDGAVALVMALDRAMKNLNGGDSIYNHRGFIVL